jgi:hypothetical protein
MAGATTALIRGVRANVGLRLGGLGWRQILRATSTVLHGFSDLAESVAVCTALILVYYAIKPAMGLPDSVDVLFTIAGMSVAGMIITRLTRNHGTLFVGEKFVTDPGVGLVGFQFLTRSGRGSDEVYLSICLRFLRERLHRVPAT